MIIAPDSTDVTTYFKLVDPAAGTPETALVITDLDATYLRDRSAAVKADLTVLAAVDSAHGDNKAIEVSATVAPGVYRVDWPDAAFASGAARVQLLVTGAAIDPAILEVELATWMANLDVPISSRATPADVQTSLAISETEAAAAATGSMAITLHGSFDQTVESDTTEDLSAADALIWAVKADRKRDTDAQSLVLVDVATGLRYLARQAYTGAAANGSITLGGGVGAWEIRCQLAAEVTGDLAAWANKPLDAQVKAIFGDRTVNVWEGPARINHQTVWEV